MDFSKEKTTLACPSCNRRVTVSMKQIADEATVRCSCRQNIQLKDSGGSARQGIKDIDKAFSNLGKAFKNLGK